MGRFLGARQHSSTVASEIVSKLTSCGRVGMARPSTCASIMTIMNIVLPNACGALTTEPQWLVRRGTAGRIVSSHSHQRLIRSNVRVSFQHRVRPLPYSLPFLLRSSLYLQHSDRSVGGSVSLALPRIPLLFSGSMMTVCSRIWANIAHRTQNAFRVQWAASEQFVIRNWDLYDPCSLIEDSSFNKRHVLVPAWPLI